MLALLGKDNVCTYDENGTPSLFGTVARLVSTRALAWRPPVVGGADEREKKQERELIDHGKESVVTSVVLRWDKGMDPSSFAGGS